MRKLFQNKVAEGAFTLPITAIYVFFVWLLSGLVEHRWWGQLACMAVSTYLMIELSNSNALMRVRSRMVSCVFLVLSSLSCFLFGSLPGAIVQLCFVASFITLFHSYQDKQAQGWVFYSFLCIGLASLLFVQVLFYVPLLWLLMATQLQSLGWRSWLASLLALLTPYWFVVPWLLYQQDMLSLQAHFSQLLVFHAPADSVGLAVDRVAVFAFTFILLFVSMIHSFVKSYEDRIRTRQLYGFFIFACLFSMLFLLLQPQHYDFLMRIIVICASPVIAHYFTHTSGRFTNMFFVVSLVTCVLLTLFNLLYQSSVWIWMTDYCTALWNGLLTF